MDKKPCRQNGMAGAAGCNRVWRKWMVAESQKLINIGN
jgi:hypothetical protein